MLQLAVPVYRKEVLEEFGAIGIARFNVIIHANGLYHRHERVIGQNGEFEAKKPRKDVIPVVNGKKPK
jgi:hypothetical protein